MRDLADPAILANWRAGAIFRWSYKSTKGIHIPYHCRSRIGIVDGRGELRDTYWGDNGSSAAPKGVDLEYVANLDELTAVHVDAVERYRAADIVDLRHANGGRLYLRIGAEPCREVQRAVLVGKIEVARREVEVLESMLAGLTAGGRACERS